MTDDFADFFRKQLDADAADCRGLADFLATGMAVDLPTHPARVLADVEAKRRIVDVHVERAECERCAWFDDELYPCETLKLLALPYANRTGYDESWRP